MSEIVMENRIGRIPLDLQFFAKEGPGGEKTEAATPKKLEDARKKGQVAKSRELTMSFELISMFLTLKFFVSSLGKRFINVFDWIYDKELPSFIEQNRDGLTVQAQSRLFTQVVIEMGLCVLPFFIVGVGVAFLGDFLQVKWKVSTEPMKPSLDRKSVV